MKRIAVLLLLASCAASPQIKSSAWDTEVSVATTTTTAPPVVTTTTTEATTTTSTSVAVATPPVVAPTGSRCQEWYNTALLAGWPASDWKQLSRFMWRESRCNPAIRSKTSDTGLMQINDVNVPWLESLGIPAESLYDGFVNLYAARLLFMQSKSMFDCGWHPWGGTC